MKDFYYILGVDAACTSAEIEEAYQKLSAIYNPEANASDQFFANRFADVREAYDVLHDRAKRPAYDIQLNKSRSRHAEERYRIKKYHSSAKGVNTGLTMVLVVLTLVFGYYVVKAFHATQTVKTAAVLTSSKAPVHPVKLHRRKHQFRHPRQTKKIWAVIRKDTVRRKPVDAAPLSVKPVGPVAKPVAVFAAVTKPKPVEAAPAVVAPAVTPPAAIRRVQPEAANDENPERANYLYETYLKANQTGLVRLRAEAGYNAEVITNLPNNARVRVLERGAYYYKIAADNRIGYVPKWTVQEK